MNEGIAGLGGPAIIIELLLGMMLARNIARVTGHMEIMYWNHSFSR